MRSTSNLYIELNSCMIVTYLTKLQYFLWDFLSWMKNWVQFFFATDYTTLSNSKLYLGPTSKWIMMWFGLNCHHQFCTVFDIITIAQDLNNYTKLLFSFSRRTNSKWREKYHRAANYQRICTENCPLFPIARMCLIFQ